MPAKTVEMVVGLKVPDNTAITTLQTLKKIGFGAINGVKREDYYKFLIEGDESKFMKGISKADVLVNANKHYYGFSVKKDGSIKILVSNINDGGSGILSMLRERLGFKNIKRAEKGTLWSLSIGADEKEMAKIAENAARELLVNENYQEFRII